MDVFDPESQRFFDLQAAEDVVSAARSQLASAKIALRMKLNEISDGDLDSVSVDELTGAVAYHAGIIALMTEYAEEHKALASPPDAVLG